ncbi:MAG TPA: hypothetical protein PKE00_02170 [Planctomycetota bacterium]|nr:hypothetical protein [Planctomycetota bacterium]
MILRRIVAPSMAKALERVQRELGPDALIVGTDREDECAVVYARRAETSPVAQAPTKRAPRAVTPIEALEAQLSEAAVSKPVQAAVLRAVGGLDSQLVKRGSRALPGIARRILAGLFRTERLRGKRIALVGPTGVGKTTTIAKLAARDALERGRSTAIITTDTYRVAAVEQLRAFADMMDLPFRVAFTPQDLREALDAFADRDRVWIDSAGRSPRDENALRGLRGSFRGLDIDVLLCLPAAGRRRDLEVAFRSFGAFEPEGLVVCKWDETDVYGEVLSMAIERDMPIIGQGTGQRVPEDWQDADAQRFALELLPSEEHTPPQLSRPHLSRPHLSRHDEESLTS